MLMSLHGAMEAGTMLNLTAFKINSTQDRLRSVLVRDDFFTIAFIFPYCIFCFCYGYLKFIFTKESQHLFLVT